MRALIRVSRTCAIRMVLISSVVLAPVGMLPVVHGQTAATSVNAQAADTAIRLYTVLGPYSRKISTSVREAQAYFDQGVQLLYSFTPLDAARSFAEAGRRDSTCAMCFFGQAWAWGPYLNGPMNAKDGPAAYAAIQRAVALKSRATAVERELIDAMALRYESTWDARRRKGLDSAYSTAMERVYAKYPNDPEVATLYAESLMLLMPRRGIWDVTTPQVQRIHRVLEDLLKKNLNHPGACHLFVHATETTPMAGNAQRCADLLGQSIPGASHINHMPSHTYNRVGRWGDAVRANIEAWHSDIRSEWGEGFAIYPSHNLHMLLFSASYDGQGAIATQAAKDYAKISAGGVFYQSLTLVRFGRFDEVLQLGSAPLNPLYRGMWEFARGYAHLRLNNVDSARVYLRQVRQAARSIPDSMMFRGHTAARLLGTLGGILHGELLLNDKKSAEAIAAFEGAIALEDALVYDEPEPLPFAARHWLGAALLDAGRATDAERVYREELTDHPRNGWSLSGLEKALKAQNKTNEARNVRTEFLQSWARSDMVVRSSRP